MTRKKRRAILILAGVALCGVAAGLTGWGLRTKVDFFKSPTEVLNEKPKPGTRFRLGGLIEAGTFHTGTGAAATFKLTDCSNSLPVTYIGEEFLPDLFKEGQGAIAEGYLAPDGTFVATKGLAKHDEKYMPPEVGSTLKKGGCWQAMTTNPKASRTLIPARTQP